jgi:AcrR family transcriptional regulator
MGKREDGRDTRRRLLNAACEVFAERGYQKAKVADICRRAGANVASVNYYFGTKSSLYKQAWHHALNTFEDPVLPEPGTGSPRERLRAYIRNLIRNFTAEGEAGRFGRLYLMEMVNPTGLIQEAWHEIIEPRRRKLQALIQDIMGPEGARLQVLFCELSIVNQCRTLVTVKRSDLEYMLGRPLDPQLIEQLADHIADFSLAGIQAAGGRRTNQDG